jgi:AMIN domain
MTLATLAIAQPRTRAAASRKPAPVVVRSIRIVPGADGAAVEIITTHPLSPKILVLKDPSRLVIDLPEAYVSLPKTLDFRSDQVNGVRINQFQKDPPVARIVLDLAKPVSYSWDAAGNRLMVRLRPTEPSVTTASMPGFTQGVASSMAPLGSDGSTPMVENISPSAGASSVSAGADTTILRLSRGGEVRVCPGTTVSVTYSKSGHDMLLGMNTGSIETHYSLGSSSDTVMTPDFRILLTGPGEFHYAISADVRGNTCVRTLPGNDASAIVSELLGDKSYQVKPADEVVFRGGHIAMMGTTPPADCGCPPPSTPVLRTSAAPVPQAATQSPAGSVAGGTAPQVSMGGAETAPLPASSPNQVHVQVDAPFVYRATDPPPAPLQEVARLRLSYAPPPEPFEVRVLPPAPAGQADKAKHAGFFGKIKGFFAAIFR